MPDDPLVREIGRLTDDAGRVLIVGVSYDAVTLRTLHTRTSGAVALGMEQQEELGQLLITAAWQAAWNRGQMDADADRLGRAERRVRRDRALAGGRGGPLHSALGPAIIPPEVDRLVHALAGHDQPALRYAITRARCAPRRCRARHPPLPEPRDHSANRSGHDGRTLRRDPRPAAATGPGALATPRGRGGSQTPAEGAPSESSAPPAGTSSDEERAAQRKQWAAPRGRARPRPAGRASTGAGPRGDAARAGPG